MQSIVLWVLGMKNVILCLIKKCSINTHVKDHKGEHANKNAMHKDKLNCDISVPEGSLCDDTFASNEEYTEHVNKTHLNEIQKVDFDDLKNLHEVF